MKEASQKVAKWSRKDVTGVVLVYVLNVIVMTAIYILFRYFSRGKNFDALIKYLAQPKNLLTFFVLSSLSSLFMLVFFLMTDKDFLREPINSEMLFLIIELCLVICILCCEYVNYYLCPFAVAGLLTLFLTNTKNALFINMIFGYIWIVFFTFLGMNDRFNGLADQTVLYYIMNIVAGTVAILVMDGVYSRVKVVIRSLFVSLPYLVVVAFSLFAYAESDVVPSVVAALVSGPLSIICFTILLPVFEGIFKKVSCFKYAELTDHKAKFIKKMIEQAPGTFNHAVIVANVAENCATAIGEDSMLARTCAYYHDVGKLRRPEYFKENQAGLEDPHEGLTPELSSNIIRSHAQDGYDLLIKNRFPKQIADACAQHHGTLPIYFFYDKAKKFTDGEVSIEQFCYTGPKPQSKIAAILMIADSSEAATRTLTDRSREKVSEVVRNIVNERMKLGQFDECEITLKEITLIINAVINSLTGVYHRRVEYPKVTLDGLYKDVVKED